MDNSPKTIKEWFGYSRRERRATIILIIIVLGVFSFRFITPEPGDIPLTEFLGKDTGLIDTNPVMVPVVRSETVVKQAKPKVLLIELNRCDSAELVKLPGIGPVLSGRIIKFRRLLGGFAHKSQLLEVYGLPPDTYNLIAPMVTTDTSLLIKIQINTGEYRDIIKHPYFSTDDVAAILRYRKQMGPIENWNTIEQNNLIRAGRSEFLRYYISFN